MRKAAKFLIVLAVLSFIVIFALQAQNNMETLDYYSEKEQKAKQELELLENAYGQSLLEGGFEITQERIDVINTATDYIKKFGDFAEWCDLNLEGTNVEKCYNVFEDYVNSIDHIMLEIEKIMPVQ